MFGVRMSINWFVFAGLAIVILLQVVFISAILSIVVIPIYYAIKNSRLKARIVWLTNRKLKLILLLMTLSISGLAVYSSYYPGESEYINEFERETGLNFPSSYTFISKELSIPDMHGRDYSNAVVELSAAEYKALFDKIMNDSTFLSADKLYAEDSIKSDNSTFSRENYLEKYTSKCACKNRISVSFLDDNKTIHISRSP